MRKCLQYFAPLLLAALAAPAWALPTDLDVYESFNSISPNTVPNVSFDVGSSPAKATFSGNAFAGVVGQGALYNQSITPGNKSWMVLENSVGRVDFDLNAAEVEFFARAHPNANGNTVIGAYDDGNNLIGPEVTLLPGAAFASVSFSGDIDHILFDNQATNIMNGIDDFGFTPVPEPATVVLLGVGLVGVLIARRR